MASSKQAGNAQPEKAAVALMDDVPKPWRSTLKHLSRGDETLSKADLISCLTFFERPESWIFFVLDKGANPPPVINLQLHRHVVFIVMLEHWVVVHVDLVDMEAGYLDPRSSDRSNHPIRLRHMLVRWLAANLHREDINETLNFFQKECQQNNDSSIIAISNVIALARGYSCSSAFDPAKRRADFIQEMKVLTRSKRPNLRLAQWNSPSGLRTAGSLFKNADPEPRKTNVPSSVGSHKSSRPKHPLASSTVPPATISPPAATSSKRKLEAPDATPDAPFKRRQIFHSKKEQKSSGWFSGWWTNKMDPATVSVLVIKLSKELRLAEANLQTIRGQVYKMAEHFNNELRNAEADIKAIIAEKDNLEEIIKGF
ncbi:hypothetical protein NCS52_00971900 [Fusarium sp. LHS14.1]|nr:hypothetical protein NCS52_00971900 [Fusarium sp. LHS14.1]